MKEKNVTNVVEIPVEEELTEVKQKRNRTLRTQKLQQFPQVSASQKKNNPQVYRGILEVVVTEIVPLPITGPV